MKQTESSEMGFCPLTYLNTEKLYQVYIFFSLGFLLGVYLVHAPPCCPGLAQYMGAYVVGFQESVLPFTLGWVFICDSKF